MRNPFDISKAGRDKVDWNRVFSVGADSSSPDHIGLYWNNTGELIAASPAASEAPGSFDMDITRLPVDFNLSAALSMRREKNLEVTALSERTHFLTVAPGFGERTRLLALDGRILALSDQALAEWLIEAERLLLTGTDDHPIFESALLDTSCVVSRLPNGQVAMTEVPRQLIESARDKIRPLSGSPEARDLRLTVETPIRSATRYFLTAVPEGANALRPEKENEITAVVLIGRAGFNFGLWSASAGLFSEYGFLAPSEISRQDSNAGRVADGEADGRQASQNLDGYIRHAFDQVFLQLSPDRLEQLQLTGYAQVVWATELGLNETVAHIAGEYAERSGVDFFQLGIPFDEAIAGGLLFGSFNFGDESVAGAEILPPINMARDLLALADSEETERRQHEESMVAKRRNRAVMALAAMPVIVCALLLAFVANLVRAQVMLAVRDASASIKAAELKPALDRRNGYEANLKWYQEFIKQVSSLRRQQPVGIGMLYELNPAYPFNLDQSFYISDLKLQPNGSVEIKGLARNKDAVTSFLRSLEFSGGQASGTKLFSNLTYEVQEGVAQPAAAPGQPNLPPVAGGGLGVAKPAPGVIAWSIRGNYLPMAEFVPVDPKTQPKPGAPNAPPNPNTPNPNAPANPNAQGTPIAPNTAPKPAV